MTLIFCPVFGNNFGAQVNISTTLFLCDAFKVHKSKKKIDIELHIEKNKKKNAGWWYIKEIFIKFW